MKITKIQDTITKQISNFKFQKLVIGHWLLVIIWLLLLGYWSLTVAMGSPPPAKEESKEKPKYNVKTLKMEVINSPTPEVKIKTKAKDLSTRKALMVIAPRDFHDEELSTPQELFKLKGVKVTVAAATSEAASGMYGARVKPDILLKDARAADYDAIIFVGGDGASVYYQDADALGLAIEAQKQNKVLGAICIAPLILGKAGVLEGKKATVSPFAAKDLKDAGAIYTGENVEVDGKIITGKGPGAAEEFGRAILGALQKE
jgi:protease I